METYLKSNLNSVVVSYDEVNNIVNLYFFGNIVHEDYISGCKKMLHFLQEKKCSKVMFDNRELKLVSTQSRAWAVRSMLPKMYSPSLKVAIINSKNFSSQIAVDTMLEFGEQMGYKMNQVKAFETLEEGFDFLMHKKKEI
ncbi:MAG: hypothetical protein ACI85I_001355 [Arenicella sp.]|jgi:hypothetical protein